MEILNLANTEMMSSREIAELCKKEHHSVVRTIAFLNKEGCLHGVETEEANSQNKQTYKVYHFDRDNSIVLVARLDPKFMKAIIDRWQELEAMQVPVHKIPKTLSEALLLGAELAKKVEEQALQLEAQAPSVAYVENFVKCDGLIGIREAAKSLGLQQNAFVQMLVAAKIMFRENGHLQAYATDIDAKRFVVKVTKDLSGKARSQTMLTAKGIRWVANKLELDKLFAND